LKVIGSLHKLHKGEFGIFKITERTAVVAAMTITQIIR